MPTQFKDFKLVLRMYIIQDDNNGENLEYIPSMNNDMLMASLPMSTNHFWEPLIVKVCIIFIPTTTTV